MTSTTYGVLLLSFSRHSHQRNFVDGFTEHPRTQIVAVADDDNAIDDDLRARNRRHAEQLGVPYVADVATALQRGDVDIVSIGHDIERRSDLACQAAEAGKHLWIDKFTGASLPECRAVVQAVEQHNIRAIVPSYHYGSLVQQALDLLAGDRLGDLLAVHVDMFFAKGWPRPGAWRSAPPAAAEGRWKYDEVKRELLTVGAYCVGLLQACLDTPHHVMAHGGARFFHEHAQTRTEDFATLTMTDQAGRVGTLSAGRIGVAAHPAGGPSVARLVGTRATVTIDAKRPGLHRFLRSDIVDADHRPAADDPMQWASGPEALHPALSPDPAGLRAALNDFVAALDEQRAPRYSAQQAYDNMVILLAGYRSMAAGGRLVTL